MDVLKECDLLLRLPVAEKVGVDRPGGDGVDVDASRAEVLRERTGYLLDGAFRRDIEEVVWRKRRRVCQRCGEKDDLRA